MEAQSIMEASSCCASWKFLDDRNWKLPQGLPASNYGSDATRLKLAGLSAWWLLNEITNRHVNYIGFIFPLLLLFHPDAKLGLKLHPEKFRF
ncbi:MAG: hypothetical protein EA393_12210 [Bacteroidetes bacterium]|nr:MAG: hypothetical protein EA393_12210 [Bacteroidota bacterium]